MPSQDVRLSVRLSFRLSYAGTESKRLYISSTPPFSFSHTKRDGNIPTGTPLTGASNAMWYEKNHDFRQIYRFISQIMQDRAIVTMQPPWGPGRTGPPTFKTLGPLMGWSLPTFWSSVMFILAGNGYIP